LLISRAHVDTERANRYLAQLCRHFSNLRRHESRMAKAPKRPDIRVHVECSERHGTITFDDWGRCTMDASPEALTLSVEAPDEGQLRRVQGLVGEHVERFGKRDDLKVNWQHD
jgi:hypothetical protein